MELSGLSDASLTAFLAAQGDNVSRMEIRAELDYLAGRGKEYVEITERAHRLWMVKLTPAGVDLLDERRPADPGVVIAR